MRRETKAVKIRDIVVGGGAPVSVQSMTKTNTSDVAGYEICFTIGFLSLNNL